MNKAIFLDRDGVLNQEIGDYVYTTEQFVILPGVPEALQRFKAAGYKLVVVTNQGGIAKGLYTPEVVKHLYQLVQDASGHALDALYFSPWHSSKTRSLLAKPDSLMLEKAIARFDIDTRQSYIIGDAARDLEAGAKVGVKGILVPTLKEQSHPLAVAVVPSLAAAADFILQ